MKKLTRPLPGPTCLDQYKQGRDNWSSLDFECRQSIREELWNMQGKFCAYCERQAPHESGHIEHFIQKGRVPKMTFEWNNLFWSCRDTTTCEEHKDRQASISYKDEDLIKPDVDNPDKFFVYGVAGEIMVNPMLETRDEKRASETIRVFNLNDPGGSIKSRRAMSFKTWAPQLYEILELIEDDTPDAIDLFEQEVSDLLQEIQRLEFSGSTTWFVRNVLKIS